MNFKLVVAWSFRTVKASIRRSSCNELTAGRVTSPSLKRPRPPFLAFPKTDLRIPAGEGWSVWDFTETGAIALWSCSSLRICHVKLCHLLAGKTFIFVVDDYRTVFFRKTIEVLYRDLFPISLGPPRCFGNQGHDFQSYGPQDGWRISPVRRRTTRMTPTFLGAGNLYWTFICHWNPRV